MKKATKILVSLNENLLFFAAASCRECACIFLYIIYYIASPFEKQSSIRVMHSLLRKMKY
jgi:hypothetical protein